MSATSSKPIRSMTGFARVRRITPSGEIVFSLRGVNHRGLDLHFHMAADFEPQESALRKRISQEIIRGHIDIRLFWNRNKGSDAAGFNRPMLEAWLEAFRSASREYGLQTPPDLNAALRMPGMFGDTAVEELPPEVEAAVLDALEEALKIFNAHRVQEGAETAAVLGSHAQSILASAARIGALRDGILPALQQRLRDKLADLLGTSMDPARLAQEAALLADRSDIGEETTRLKIHTTRMVEMLDAGGELGKKLEFLLQEMHREVNTILSKCNGTGETGRGLSELGLAVKSEIEKIREQSLNLE